MTRSRPPADGRRREPPGVSSVTQHVLQGTLDTQVQAAGEYLDHVRGARSWETRLNRTLIRPEPLKHRARSLIRELAISAV